MGYEIAVESEAYEGRGGNYIARASGGGEECFKIDNTEGRARKIARSNLIALLEGNERLNKD